MNIKTGIVTKFVMSYPVMSVYEFEFLKTEQEVMERWADSSIYMICQRPVLFFDEVTPIEGAINLKIRQKGKCGELIISIPTAQKNQYFGKDDNILLNIQFFKEPENQSEPYNNVAGIQLFDEGRNFLGWLTPERLIYELIHLRIRASVEGDIADFLSYKVHYIGQAQDQDIWKRLTGHEKLSSILATKLPYTEGEFSPYELSLIFFRLDGAETFCLMDPSEDEQQSEAEFEEKWIIGNQSPTLNAIAKNIVNDFEAFMVNFFLPDYNKIQFKSYPDIKNGLKSRGYDVIQHDYATIAAIYTDEARTEIEITPIRKKSLQKTAEDV